MQHTQLRRVLPKKGCLTGGFKCRESHRQPTPKKVNCHKRADCHRQQAAALVTVHGTPLVVCTGRKN